MANPLPFKPAIAPRTTPASALNISAYKPKIVSYHSAQSVPSHVANATSALVQAPITPASPSSSSFIVPPNVDGVSGGLQSNGGTSPTLVGSSSPSTVPLFVSDVTPEMLAAMNAQKDGRQVVSDATLAKAMAAGRVGGMSTVEKAVLGVFALVVVGIVYKVASK